MNKSITSFPLSYEGMWPPKYTLNTHPRARHVKLKASNKHGLEIVVPPGFNLQELHSILEKNRTWIEKKLKEIAFSTEEVALPNIIFFPAFNQTWKIVYIKTETSKISMITRPTAEVVLLGNISNVRLCVKALTVWLKRHAKKLLLEMLNLQSKRTNLIYNKLTIRDQSSRWGSCSCERNINLNFKLIFLPQELIDHILIHELSHTVHMNHSDKFWRLVARHDADWRKHKKELLTAEKYIPNFLKT